MPFFLIGGTGFIGRHVAQRLVDAGHAVTVFHRGQTAPNFPDTVGTRHGDRNDPEAVRNALDATAPDVVLDLIPYTETQAEILATVCIGRTDVHWTHRPARRHQQRGRVSTV